jgi:hypothetical protein
MAAMAKSMSAITLSRVIGVETKCEPEDPQAESSSKANAARVGRSRIHVLAATWRGGGIKSPNQLFDAGTNRRQHSAGAALYQPFPAAKSAAATTQACLAFAAPGRGQDGGHIVSKDAFDPSLQTSRRP